MEMLGLKRAKAKVVYVSVMIMTPRDIAPSTDSTTVTYLNSFF